MGGPNLRTVSDFEKKQKKFKNAYAGWIWAVAGTSLFGTPLDAGVDFRFFSEILYFRK